jgi:hypothetical protein
MNRTTSAVRRSVLPVLLALAFAGCNGNGNNDDAILPLQAAVTIPDAPSGDPVVFFQKSPSDTITNDDIVGIDVMFQSNAGTVFSAFTMEIHFNPGVIQVGQVDLTSTPLGDCTATTGLFPICSDNAATSSVSPANDTGTLLIGVGARSGGPLANVTGPEKLFTLRFIGASVGTSLIEFVDGPGNGDCEILAEQPAPDPPLNLGVPCQSGRAMVTVAR